MKLSLDLSSHSSAEWLDCVMSDFNAFLQDHADCERKASAMAMSMVAKYPDRVDIIPELIETGIEELEHFQKVYEIMAKRGVNLRHEIVADEYVNALIALCHSDQKQRAMDRMLLCSVIECRGAERFKLVSQRVEDPELKQFYNMLWTSEAKHGNIFVKMALKYYPKEKIYERLKYFMEKEAEILANLPIRPALH